MLRAPQYRVSERGTSVLGGAKASHTVLAHLAEFEEQPAREAVKQMTARL